MFLKLLIISIVVIAFLFVGLAIKVLFNKEKEVKKSCTSELRTTHGKKVSCGCGHSGRQLKGTSKNANFFVVSQI